MPKDNIIDFNSRKASKKQPEPLPMTGPQHVMDALTEYFSALPQNGLMEEAGGLATEMVGRVMLYTTIVAKVSEVIINAGLDPDNFELDDESYARFMQIDITDDEPLDEDALNDHENLWNGPWFDWSDEDTTYRVATTIIISSQGIGALGMDLLRIEEDDDYWQMYNEGKWYEGPPADVFDFLIAQREDMWEDDDDEEWEASIDSMLLPPNVITALHNAGIHEIEELKELSDADLLKIKGIGKKSLEDIREALEYED